MPKFCVVLSKKASKFLESLDNKTRHRVIVDIRCLDNYPDWGRSLDIVKLQGREGYFRLRRGKIRIIFTVDENFKAIMVRKIAYREAVYE